MQPKPYRLIIGTKTAVKDKSSNLEDSNDDYGDYYVDEEDSNWENEFGRVDQGTW